MDNDQPILKKLNDKQKEAVMAVNGPLLVLAGAGSGKTRALTHRIAYLIQEHGVNPWNILAVTFTNKAAKEMKQRVSKLLSGWMISSGPSGDTFGQSTPLIFKNNFMDLRNSALPTIGTFHSICVRILREHIHLLDYEKSFAIYDDTDQQLLMKRLMEDAGMDVKKINPKAILGFISNAKNQLIGPKEFMNYVDGAFSEKVSSLYGPYQNALKQNNALDFDDLIMKTVELFTKFPEVLAHYQEKFKYISVDEYQDTNHAQYILIKLLAEKYKNICVIGDEDQSIYSWRGATIKNILDFEKDYPNAKVVFLEQNYRSTQTILDASNAIISKNRNRKPKKLWTESAGGATIKHWLAHNERHEGELIAHEINKILESYENPTYNDFVVLYRTNAQSRAMEEIFLRYGIPYKIIGGVKFYERKEIKDMLAYLRVIQNPNDSVSLFRIINVPSRKIGSQTLEVISGYAKRQNISVFQALKEVRSIDGLSDTKISDIEKFVSLIKELNEVNKNVPASGVIKHVLVEAKYRDFLDDGTAEGETRLENVSELISVANKYDSLEPGMSLSIFLEEVSLIADIDTADDSENSVTFMTVHSAKGLEFPYVFVAGLEEGIFPHNRSLMEPEQLEEERRLMYVAMTRARLGLYLLHARERTLYGESRVNAPSQFLNDIPEALVEDNFGGHGRGFGGGLGFSHGGSAGFGTSGFGSSGDYLGGGFDGIAVPYEKSDGYSKISEEEGTEGEIVYAVGETVVHNIFGKGLVIAVQGGVLTVKFDNPEHGTKKLAASVAPLRKV